MKIKQETHSTRLLRCLALGLIPILIGGCEVPRGAYRQGYGAEFSEWDNYRDSVEAPYLAQQIAPSESNDGTDNAPTGNKPPGVPVENPGRPDPPSSKIPGISDIPEIPDEPTVLPE
ncbi:MAG: hypothetical protein ACRESZ_04390 [Methylococcales bacterium]